MPPESTAESIIVPPPNTLGVWCDVRALEDYDPSRPDRRLRQRRGPAPRAVIACREALLGWAMGALPTELLPAARQRILKLAATAAALEEKRARHEQKLREAPRVRVVRQPAQPTVQPAQPAQLDDLPQDDFTAALAAVFG